MSELSVKTLSHSVQVHSAPDVFEIKVPFRNLNTNDTNCYVVISNGEALVIDTGAPTSEGGELLKVALDELGVECGHTSYFLTHFHLDHAGLVDAVACEDARVYVSKIEADAARSTHSALYFENARRMFEREGVAFIDASGFARYSVDQPLFDAYRINMVNVSEGDAIVVGKYSLQVVETSGHTAGHLSLFEPESRILFGGDHILFAISPSIALFPDGSDGLQVYLDNLAKVRSLGCSKLFLSHGDIRDDFIERIDWLDAHHRERLDETVGIVGAHPGLTGEEVVRSIRWNVPYATWEEISFIQRWCIVTEGIVILNHLVDRGFITRKLDEQGLHRYYS